MKRKSFTGLALALAISLSASTPVLASDELDLEALWVANTVKITFDSNDGRVAPDTQVYPYGEPRSLPGVCAMAKPGFTFLGWSTSKTATTPDWGPGDTSTKAFGYADETKAVAKTLYAVWGEDTGSSGGHGSYTTSSYTKGTTVQGSGYIYVIPASSGAITITIDSTPAMSYDLTTSHYSNLPSRTASLSGSGTVGNYNAGGNTLVTSQSFTASGSISGGSVSYMRTLSEPFTVPFTESICVNGAGVSSAVLFLEE